MVSVITRPTQLNDLNCLHKDDFDYYIMQRIITWEENDWNAKTPILPVINVFDNWMKNTPHCIIQ